MGMEIASQTVCSKKFFFAYVQVHPKIIRFISIIILIARGLL